MLPQLSLLMRLMLSVQRGSVYKSIPVFNDNIDVDMKVILEVNVRYNVQC